MPCRDDFPNWSIPSTHDKEIAEKLTVKVE